MKRNELETFIDVWNFEAERTARMLESLPRDQYDFRPDPEGRSLGELAWHLAEIAAYTSDGVARGNVDFSPVEGVSRPREVAGLAAGYRKVHEEALVRVRGLMPDDLDREIPFAGGGRVLAIRDILWRALLYHTIHHRGQLSLMNRLAGGVQPGLFGPNREEMAAFRTSRG